MPSSGPVAELLQLTPPSAPTITSRDQHEQHRHADTDGADSTARGRCRAPVRAHGRSGPRNRLRPASTSRASRITTDSEGSALGGMRPSAVNFSLRRASSRSTDRRARRRCSGSMGPSASCSRPRLRGPARGWSGSRSGGRRAVRPARGDGLPAARSSAAPAPISASMRAARACSRRARRRSPASSARRALALDTLQLLRQAPALGRAALRVRARCADAVGPLGRESRRWAGP